MATVKIDTFHGIAPRIHPSLLADGMAVTAHNCRLKTGKLVPLRSPRIVDDVAILMEKSYIDGRLVTLDDIADAKTMHFWEKQDGSGEFLLFPGITWMADGNLADDDRTRVVISGDTGVSWKKAGESKAYENVPAMYWRNANGTRRIYSLPKNAPPPLCVFRAKDRATPPEPLDESKEVRYTYFFLTWVDEFGYESPVSTPSLAWHAADGTKPEGYAEGDTQYNDGDSITIDWRATGFDWNDEDAYPQLAKVRIYKVVTGTEEGRIQFIKEFAKEDLPAEPPTESAMWISSFAVKDEDAGEVMMEIEGMPHDLKCVINVPGGFYAGFSPSKPKTVCFSEVDLLYSWPMAYQYDVTDNIVALAATSNTVFVLTDGWPYILSGTAPESMTVTKLAGPASCVSPRGVCVYRNALYYVGQQGLMTIYNSADAGTVCANLTDKIFTKDQWQAFNPSSCVMGQYDGALFLFFTLANGGHKALTIDLTEQMDAVTTNDEVAKCVCTDNKTDKMYFVREGV